MTIDQAYLECRKIARREAKNFYYSFRVLPRHKSDAMCAVYAFMRRADDIADDESLSVSERSCIMSDWVNSWHSVQRGEASDDAVFLAVRDTQARFGISAELLDQLVEGTAMDLKDEVKGLRTFATFKDLYGYCYLVASVVGLVCIKIFGYSDARAEKLAEETGIAFQLTNILRDVKEDAEQGRVYLPLDLLSEFGMDATRIETLSNGEDITVNDRSMLAVLGVKAEQYYRSAGELVPLIDKDSRAALWVLVNIYHDLLRRIEHSYGDVFSRRLSVPTATKIWILMQGMGMAAWDRVFA